jgi:hypothetical protein
MYRYTQCFHPTFPNPHLGVALGNPLLDRVIEVIKIHRDDGCVDGASPVGLLRCTDKMLRISEVWKS